MQSEKKFIRDGFFQGCRCDGRGLLSSRPLHLTPNVNALAAGSAQLNIELEAPHIICGCKLELTYPRTEPNCGFFELSIEIASKSSPVLRERVQQVKEMVEKLILNHLDVSQLCVIPGRKCWCIYIDVEVLKGNCSNIVEHIGYTVLTALGNTRIPRVKGIINANTLEDTVELLEGWASLEVGEVPLVISVAKVGEALALDLTLEEETTADTTLHVAVNRNHQVCGIVKENSGGLKLEEVSRVLDMAKSAAKLVFSSLAEGSIKYKVA